MLPAIHTARAPLRRAAGRARRGELAAEALESRKVVERAKGLLMAREGITEEEAYGRIRRASQRTGRPMRAIAEAVCATLERRGGPVTARAYVPLLGGDAGADGRRRRHRTTRSATPRARSPARSRCVLVAPLIAVGTDNLRGRLSPSVVGIVQSAFGNVAELALTIVALSADLPDVVRVAIAGSILGNALLLGGSPASHRPSASAAASSPPCVRPGRLFRASPRWR